MAKIQLKQERITEMCAPDHPTDVPQNQVSSSTHDTVQTGAPGGVGVVLSSGPRKVGQGVRLD